MKVLDLYGVVNGSGASPSLLILHGLLGSSRNWTKITRELADDFQSHALDLRNHGQSPHAEDMCYASMSADVIAYADKHGIESFGLIGHSMGGKAAMVLACLHPERVRGLVVVDIAPKPYPPHWEKEFAAMRALDPGSIGTRAEAERALETKVPDWALRQFLLTNLVRREAGGFRWAVNLPLLHERLPDLFAHPLHAGDRYDGPTLFVRGEQSDYVSDADLAPIQEHFPAGTIETIAGAGHNVHFDQPEAFLARMRRFFGG